KRIRQAIINIVDDSAQFDSGLNDSFNQASSPQQYSAIKRQTSTDSSTNLSGNLNFILHSCIILVQLIKVVKKSNSRNI
ncbi:hypothetical protein, partial [Corallococcus sp. AB038B]|uniref:hypothetical protein n=1 Tax=Corallococcus sp. AB038B TaxID=2316718 RepID=UPI001F2F0EBD